MKGIFVSLKLWFAVIALLVIPLNIFSGVVGGNYNISGNAIKWSLDTETGILTISGTGDMYDYTYQNTPYYSYVKQINKIVVEEGITSIGNYAFADCVNLSEISLPNSLRSIGQLAFVRCSSLPCIFIPNSVTTIKYSAFSECRKIEEFIIPKNVTSITGSLFGYCTSLASIIVDEDNTVYDSRNNCNAIIEKSTNKLISGCKNTIIPSSVTIIGNSAFACCTSPDFTSIEIPEGVTKIETDAFYWCKYLETIFLPNTLTTIEYSAFNCCHELEMLIIPQSVTSIGYTSIFGSYHSLEKIVCLSYTPPTISSNTFAYEYNIKLYVPSGTGQYSNSSYWRNFEEIENLHYRDFEVDGICYNITSGTDLTVEVTYKGGNYNSVSDRYTGKVIIPESVTYGGNTYSVTSIGESAFIDCKGLTEVVIPETVISINEYAFFGCTSLANITTSESVTNVGKYAFNGTAWYNSQPKGVVYLDNILYDYKGEMPSNSSLTIKDGTTCIAGSAFQECSNLKNISIPESVVSIGDKAFSECTGLTSIAIPGGTTYVGIDAFYRCYNITELKIGDRTSPWDISITGLHDCPIEKLYAGMEISSTWSWMETLKVLSIGDSTTNIAASAFANHSSLTNVSLGKSVTTIGSKAFYGCMGIEKISIPSSVTSIDTDAFSGCSSLVNLTIEDRKTSLDLSKSKLLDLPIETLYIGMDLVSAWKESLKTVVIGDFVTSIGSFAFSGYSKLTNVTIGKSVTNIDSQAFRDCTGLSSIVIPEAVTTIHSNAFIGCSNLMSIVVNENNKKFDSRNNCNAIIEKSTNTLLIGFTSTVIPNDIIKIGDFAFSDCTGITNISIPESVTSIGQYAFSNCSSLTEFVLPSLLTKIEYQMFSGCKKLTNITIPNSVTSIGRSAFRGCESLTNITIKNPIPSSVSTMSGIPTSATLTVPSGSAKAYSDMGGFWGQFAAIKEEVNVNISEMNMWSTCVLAFDAELPEGVRAFISTGMDENSVLMEEVTTLEAYKPYVLYAQNGYEGTLTGVVDLTAYQETVTDGVLSGAIVKQETSSGYILQNQGQGSKFYNMNGQTFTIPAGKCWLSAFDASGISVTMRFTGGVTGIEGVYVNSPADIEADETVYDLEGRRVENPQSGRVYIKGGKKVMLKN